MLEQYQLSYQNVGQNTYLTAAFGDAAVKSMVGTITTNRISHFLEASSLMMNGALVMRYNVSSRQTLSTMLKNGRQLKISEFVNLLSGAVKAFREAGEYRLPANGLVMDPDYIFVDPNSFDPGFIYLPAMQSGESGLRPLISKLITQGKVELAGNNFIQLLLVTVNEEPFSLKKLERCLAAAGQESGKTAAGRAVDAGMAAFAAENGSAQGTALPGQQTGAFLQGASPVYPQPRENGQDMYAQQGQNAAYLREGRDEAQIGGIPENTAEAVPGTLKPAPSQQAEPDVPKAKGWSPFGTGKKSASAAGTGVSKADLPKRFGKEQKEAPEAKAEAAEESGFDPEVAKKKFLLPQAAIMVLLATCISFHVFQDAEGALVMENILAAVILVVLAEVICYREAYVNSKKPKKAGTKAQKTAKAEKKQGAGRPLPPVPDGRGTFGALRSEGGAQPEANAQKLKQPSGSSLKRAGAENGISGGMSMLQQPAPDMQAFQQSGGQVFPGMQKNAQAAPVMQQQAGGLQQQPFVQLPMNQSGGVQQASMYQSGGVQRPPAYQSAAGVEAAGSEATELIDSYPYLEYFENGRPMIYPLLEPSVLAGHLANQVNLVIHNPKVGRVHAEFSNRNGQIFVTDLNSLNGTYINGSKERINSNVPYPLEDGDRVRLANCELQLRWPGR